MSEEKKRDVEEKISETPENEQVDSSDNNASSTNASDVTASAMKEAELAAEAAAAAEEAAKAAIERAETAKAKAEAAAEEEYKVIAAEVKADAAKAPDYTFKRQGEEIFRREMGEPEFWLEKEDRFPRPILTAEQQESVTRQVEIPQDQTPAYNPENVLSPEFKGVSNYERGVGEFLEVAKLELETLKHDPDATEKQIKDAEDKIIYLESLHENYFIGMNVFRTAHGGRSKITAK